MKHFINIYDFFYIKMENRTYKVKYITKSGDVHVYEYQSKYVKKGKGLNINKQIYNQYKDIMIDDNIKVPVAAGRIYGQLNEDDKAKTDIKRISSLLYRVRRGEKLE